MELFWELVRVFSRILLTFAASTVVRHIVQLRTGYPLSSYLPLSLVALLSAIGVFFFYGVIYPRFFDPLRDLPTVRATDVRELLPFGDGPRKNEPLEWMKQHPGADMVRVNLGAGLIVLLAISPQAHRDILTSKTNDWIKPESGRAHLSRVLGNGLILSEGDEHKYQRKVLTPSFRIQNIRRLQPLIAEKTSLLLSELKKAMQRDGNIEIAAWGSRVTMDIIGPSLMSKDFQSLTNNHSPLELAFQRLVEPDFWLFVTFFASLLLPEMIARNLPTPNRRKMEEAIAFVRNVCIDILSEKRATMKEKLGEDEETSDILGSILSHGAFDDTTVVDQMITFLAAGHETTASSIAWATHLLTLPQNKHYQVQLRDEILAAMASHGPATSEGILPYGVLESLPMLNGICEETLRLFPPVTNTARTAIRDTYVTGRKILKKNLIIISPWAMNRNPDFWGDDAGDFVPERWIDTLPDGTQKVNKSGGASSNMCFQTFLHGHRACIGQTFARAELRYILAAMFVENEVSRLPGDNGEVVPAGALTIKPKDGLHVTVKPWKEV